MNPPIHRAMVVLSMAFLLGLSCNISAQTLTPQVYVPTLNPNEAVVAMATPQQFGAVADGVTDNTAAFQACINAVYNAGNRAGGVIWVPAGRYAFYGNLNLPQGVTLHGDWKDWTTSGGGAVGTIFAVYTQGAAGGTAFLNMRSSTGLKGITFWYPNQNASNITPYPYTISQANDSHIQNVILVNSYQGIISPAAVRIALSTVIGSPLFIGFYEDDGADYNYQEDIRFSPAVWSSSGLSGAPAVNGPHVAWMRQNGTGIKCRGLGGGQITSLQISGYSVGIMLGDNEKSPSVSFYQAIVTNCGSAVLNQSTDGNFGCEFTNSTLIGDIAVNQTTTTRTAAIRFHSCTIQTTLGGGAPAIVERRNAWQHPWQFQNCQITGMIQVNEGSLIVTNSTINAPTQCTLASTAFRAVFAGCTFLPAKNIVNQGVSSNLIVDSRKAAAPPTPMPTLSWPTVQTRYAACRPAKTTLYVATTQYGATGNGQTDDTTAIQNALNAAGANGGGIVYLPGGKYKTTASLNIPSGVELRGVYELRHFCGKWSETNSQEPGKASVIEAYAGAGSVSGPPAIILQQNSGVMGLNIAYPTNPSSAFIPFPPTIQGRGANVYALAVVCVNSYWGIDLDTYTCTNHFMWNVDGSFMNKAFVVGNGSNNGWIVDCENHLSYWNEVSDFSNPISNLNTAQHYCIDNMQMFILGNCQNETLIKNSCIFPNAVMRCIAQGGVGPSVNGFAGAFYDIGHQGFVFEANGPSTINMINQNWMVTNEGTSTDSAVGASVSSTSTFKGTARLYNFALSASTSLYDFNVNGGDVGGEAGYFAGYSSSGSTVTAGTLHLINIGCYISDDPIFPIYNLTVGNNAGTPGKATELVGAISATGFSLQPPSLYNPNPIEYWADVSNASASILTTGALPVGWTAQDIGSTGATGSTYYYPGNAFVINASGADIYGTSDACQFVSQPATGDCTIMARVDSIGNSNSWAKTGVMIRNSLTASDMEASVLVTSNNGITFQWRSSLGGGTTIATVGSLHAPYWVSLKRSGNTFSAFMSPDGVTWTQLGSAQTINMGTNVLAGLASTSHSAGVLNPATVVGLSLTTLPNSWASQDIGNVGTFIGSTLYSPSSTGGVFQISSSGADIFGSADAFRFTYRPVTVATAGSGNCTVVAKVESIGATTSSWAKTGVMIRNSLNASDMEASVVVTPSNGVSFQWRSTSGGGTSWAPVSGNSMAAPYWVKLVQQGNSFSGYMSPDGVTWTQLGSAQTIAMGTTIYAGVAATSHNATALNPSLVSNVSLLASPWSAQDIGSPGATGSTSLSVNNVFALTGAGSDIGGSGEAFQFCSQPISGNCTITARVNAINNTNNWAKAGVMIRNSLNAGDLEAEVVVTPGNGVSFQYPNGQSSTGSAYAAPYWVQLQRSGNTFSAKMSSDGINWASLGNPQTIAMGSAVYVGLAVTSHNAGVLTTGSIDQVTLSP